MYVFFRMRASFKLPRRGSTVREARAAAAAGASKKTSTRQCNRSVQRVLYTLGAESGCPGAQIRRLQIRLGVTKHLPSSELACATPKLRENSSKRENICWAYRMNTLAHIKTSRGAKIFSGFRSFSQSQSQWQGTIGDDSGYISEIIWA